MKTKIIAAISKVFAVVLPNVLLLQTLAIPMAYGRPVSSESAYEYQTETTLELPSEMTIFFDEMNEYKSDIYGSTEELQKAQSTQAEFNDVPKKSVRGDRVENSQNWSAFTLLNMHYSRAELFKKGDFFVPLKPVFTELIEKSSRLHAKFIDLRDNGELAEDQIVQLVLMYTAMVYLPIEDLFSIYAMDKETEEFRKSFLNTIRPQIAQAHINDENRNLFYAQGIELKRVSSMADYFSFNGGKYTIHSATSSRLMRDILALTMVPTSHFYLRLSKLMTLSTMLSQSSVYSMMIGDQAKVEIPKACQNAENGNLPATIALDLPEKETRDSLMEALLYKNSLIIAPNSQENRMLYDAYRDYYLDYVPASLEQGGFSGLLVFEKYFNAKSALGLKSLDNRTRASQPSIDDVTDFNTVITGKLAYVLHNELGGMKKLIEDPHANESVKQVYRARVDFVQRYIDKLVNINEKTQLNNYLSEKMAQDDQYDVAVVNSYLAEKLKQSQPNKEIEYSSWLEIVPERVKEQLRRNEIRINEMPTLRSTDSWRRWALSEMVEFFADFITKEEDTQNPAFFHSYIDILMACRDTDSSQNPVCQIEADRSFLKNYRSDHRNAVLYAKRIAKKALEFLTEFKDEAEYTPKINFDFNQLEKVYPFLQRLWSYLQGASLAVVEKDGSEPLLPGTITNEWSFIEGQIYMNKWAQWRLSYLLLKDESVLENDLSNGVLTKIFEELKMNEPLKPFWGDKLLSSKEKKLMWKNVVTVHNEQNDYLLNVTVDGRENGKEYYEILREVNDMNLFTEDAIQKALGKVINNIDSEEADEEIEAILDSREYEFLGSLRKLYELRGQPELQEELVYELMDEHYDDFWDEYDIKLKFLDLDTRLRAPIYRHAIKEAAFIKRQKLQKNMEVLCLAEAKLKTDEVKRLHSLTMTAQKKLNEQFGITMPTLVEKKSHGWNEDDKIAFWWGMSAGILAAVAGLVCPLSIPLWIGLAAASAGSAGIAIYSEAHHFAEGRKFSEQVTDFEEIGLTDSSGHSYVKHSLAWVVMEVVFSIPIFAQFKMAGKVGVKILKNMAAGMYKGMDKAGRKLAFLAIKNEVMSEVAQKLLRNASQLGLKQGTSNKLISALLGSGNIKTIQKAGIEGTIESTNLELVEIFSKMFGDSTLQFQQNYFKKYVKPYVKKVEKQFNKLKKQLIRAKMTGRSDEAFTAFEKLQKFMKNVNKSSQKMANEGIDRIFGMRADYSQLGSMIKDPSVAVHEVEEAVEALGRMHLQPLMKAQFFAEELEGAVRAGLSLSDFLKNGKHLDIFCSLVPGLRNRAGDFFFQMFAGGYTFAGKQLPIVGKMIPDLDVLAKMAPGAMIRKFVAARNVVALDAALDMARRELHLPMKMYMNNYGLYQHFTDLAAESGVEGMVKMEEKIAGNILTYMNSKRSGFGKAVKTFANVDDLKSLLRSGSPQAQALFDSVPSEVIYGVRVTQDTAAEVALKLSNYSNLDQFEKFVNAMKVLSISKKPDILRTFF